jgi:hypothetical protein
MSLAGDSVNSQSCRGHRITSTETLSAMKQPIANHAAVWTWWAVIACPPKNDVVIAAAAMSWPARERVSLTVLS